MILCINPPASPPSGIYRTGHSEDARRITRIPRIRRRVKRDQQTIINDGLIERVLSEQARRLALPSNSSRDAVIGDIKEVDCRDTRAILPEADQEMGYKERLISADKSSGEGEGRLSP